MCLGAQNYNNIKDKFNQLSKKEKETLLLAVYGFSKETKTFLEGWFGLKDSDKEYIEQMKRETLYKVYMVRSRVPLEPDGQKVNQIISHARKAKVGFETILRLENMAYRGFIESLNEYGGGPENFEDMAANHMERYIKLIKLGIEDRAKQNNLLLELKNYLLDKRNMGTDYFVEVFELFSGIKIDHP